MNSLSRLRTTCLLLVIPATLATGQSILNSWSGLGLTNKYSNPLNWSLTALPILRDDVTFGALSGSIVEFDLAPKLGNIVVESHGGEWHLEGNSLISDALRIEGPLDILNGSIHTHHFSISSNTSLIGQYNNPDARVQMTITGGAWMGGPATADTRLVLHSGSQMNISDGPDGEGFTMGATGFHTWLELNGTGTELSVTTRTRVGLDGTSNIDVTSGAQASFTDLYVGMNSSSSSSIVATGADTMLRADTAYIGHGGYGQITLNDEAVGVFENLKLGVSDSLSYGMLEVDSVLKVNSAFEIGYNGYGQVFSAEGALIEVGTESERPVTRLGINAGSYGSLFVSDEGTRAILGGLQVGVAGTANLGITSGALMTNDGDVTVGNNSLVMVDFGSQWEIDGKLEAQQHSSVYLGGESQVTATAGVSIEENASLILASASITTPTLRNAGFLRVAGNSTLSGDLINSGTLAFYNYAYSVGDYSTDSTGTTEIPLLSMHQLNVLGDLTLTDTSSIEMFFDLHTYLETPLQNLISVTGDVDLAGALVLDFYAELLPWGSEFSLIEFTGSLSGDFSEIHLGSYFPDLEIQLMVRDHALIAKVVPEPSTWALMGIGVVVIGVASLRHRRGAKSAAEA